MIQEKNEKEKVAADNMVHVNWVTQRKTGTSRENANVKGVGQ